MITCNAFLSMVLSMLSTITLVRQDSSPSLAKGKEALAARKTEEAIKHLTDAISHDPKKPDAYYYRGLAFDQAFEYKKAIADLTEAIKLNPKFAKAFVARGNAHVVLGDKQKAIDDLTEAIKHDPKSAEAFGYRGMVFGEMEEHVRALADYASMSKLLPKSPAPHIEIAKILSACSNAKVRDGKSALEHALKAHELDGPSWQTLEVVASSYAELGKFDEAVKWQKDALKAFPEGAEPIKKPAEARLKLYEMKKALRYKIPSDWLR